MSVHPLDPNHRRVNNSPPRRLRNVARLPSAPGRHKRCTARFHLPTRPVEPRLGLKSLWCTGRGCSWVSSFGGECRALSGSSLALGRLMHDQLIAPRFVRNSDVPHNSDVATQNHDGALLGDGAVDANGTNQYRYIQYVRRKYAMSSIGGARRSHDMNLCGLRLRARDPRGSPGRPPSSNLSAIPRGDYNKGGTTARAAPA
jgi:hypothetical protein